MTCFVWPLSTAFFCIFFLGGEGSYLVAFLNGTETHHYSAAQLAEKFWFSDKELWPGDEKRGKNLMSVARDGLSSGLSRTKSIASKPVNAAQRPVQAVLG